MPDTVSTAEIADTMYKLVEEYTGKKKFKAQDLVKEAIMKYGEDKVSKADGKQAMKMLIDSGRCVYTYFGGSFVELPPKEE
ncbi:hypothetical protein ACFLVG_03560 [Chloroflexota bacterium]